MKSEDANERKLHEFINPYETPESDVVVNEVKTAKPKYLKLFGWLLIAEGLFGVLGIIFCLLLDPKSLGVLFQSTLTSAGLVFGIYSMRGKQAAVLAGAAYFAMKIVCLTISGNVFCLEQGLHFYMTLTWGATSVSVDVLAVMMFVIGVRAYKSLTKHSK